MPFNSFPVKPDLPPNGYYHEIHPRRPMTAFEMGVDNTLYVFFVPNDGEPVCEDFALYKAVLPSDIPEDKVSYQLITSQGIMNCIHVDDEKEYAEVATIIDALARDALEDIGATAVSREEAPEDLGSAVQRVLERSDDSTGKGE